MNASVDTEALLRFLPESSVGVVERIDPIRVGLSGAGVYGVTASRGAFVLRVQDRTVAGVPFSEHSNVVRRAADAGIAPAIVHVDEANGVLVSVRVIGTPFTAALHDPAQRGLAIQSVVDRLRVLHSLDASGVPARDPLAYARKTWEANKSRDGFPAWAKDLASSFAHIEATLARDARRVLSHNDVNPLNVLWDGARAWLVDWEVAGLAHPHYDLAALAMFLRLDEGVAFELCAMHDGAPLDERGRETFRALRMEVGIFCGLTFLGPVDDLTVRTANAITDAPSLLEVYQGIQARTVDLQSPRGKIEFGLALLANALAG